MNEYYDIYISVTSDESAETQIIEMVDCDTLGGEFAEGGLYYDFVQAIPYG